MIICGMTFITAYLIIPKVIKHSYMYFSAIAFQFVNVDLGPLKSVTVRHDNKGGKESWFINHVSIISHR